MGESEPGDVSGKLTIEDLVRWEEHGATWRVREVTDSRVVVDLCTCSGEAVDFVEGDDAEVISFVRARRASGSPR